MEHEALMQAIANLHEWVGRLRARALMISEACRQQDLQRSQRYNAYSIALWRVGAVLNDVLRWDYGNLPPLVYVDRALVSIIGETRIIAEQYRIDPATDPTLRIYRLVLRKIQRLSTYTSPKRMEPCPVCHVANPSTTHLMDEYCEMQKASLSGMFRHNATNAMNAVATMLLTRGITSIPNMFGPILIKKEVEKL